MLAHLQPEPLQNLSSLVKAQLIYYSTAAEVLSVRLASRCVPGYYP